MMEIVTQRFLLRDFIPEDEPAFSAYRADPRYAEFCTAAEVTASFSHELFQRFNQWATESPRRNYQLAIVDRRSPQLIGCAGLRREENDSDWAELGIELAPQFWGRYAYAIEIVEALIEFGFRDLDLQEIRGISVSANRRVTRLAQRYGFVAIAMPSNPDWMKEREWYHIEWQLTRQSWKQGWQNKAMFHNKFKRSPNHQKSCMKTISPDYKIRSAQIEDLVMLAEIERAAATLFRDTLYAFLVDAETLSLNFVTQQFQLGRVWVAVDDRDTPIGYAIAQEVDGNAYLREIDVHPSYGRRGIGRKLVERVCLWAKKQDYQKIFLSTFRDIEWNAPFYAKLGFLFFVEDELTYGFQQIRHNEAEAGLPIDLRVIMYREL